jgi:hypothetical protein
MLGLMSTVFFLTPAHAKPTASAHASVIPVMVLVAIMWFLLRKLGWLPLVLSQGLLLLCLQGRGRPEITKAS